MEELVKILKEKKYKISFAESCTGGFLASSLTDISGSSEIFQESYVCYSNEVKTKVLGVSKDILDKYSVYSRQTVIQMVKGLYDLTNSDVCVATSGLADSNDYNENNIHVKAKTLFVAIYIKEDNCINGFVTQIDSNTKKEFKEKSLNYILEILKKLLKKL